MSDPKNQSRRATDGDPGGNDGHLCPAMDNLDARFLAGSERMKRLEAKIDGNSADTKEVLDILHAGKGFFKVVGWIGNTIKWVAAIGAPLVAFWFAIKHGDRL